MFRFIKRLFGETESPEVVSNSSSRPLFEVENCPAPVLPPPEPKPPAPARVAVGGCLEIPLQPIAVHLPPSLRSRLNRSPGRTDLVKLPLATALEQLPRGAVKIPFRDLKHCAPPGIFSGGADLDATIVDVPLVEILSRIKPSYLARRPEQKRLPLPDGVPAVFTSRLSAKPASRSEPVPLARTSTGQDELQSTRLMADAAAKPPVPSEACQAGTRGSVAPAARSNGATSPGRGVERTVAQPQPEPVKVPLVSLARNWPEPMRRDILGTHLAASVSIPFAEFEAAMKRGKVLFTWKQLRSWIVPKPTTTLTEHDAVSLELPLAVLTPLLLARRSVTASLKKKGGTEEIPDVFTGRASTNAGASAPEPKTAPREPAMDSRSLEQRLTESLGAIPTQPKTAASRTFSAGAASQPDQLTLARSSALPTELVQRACHLSGVSGALLSTNDGLVIASQLPSGMKAETAAAFLPEIFNRLGQYTRELKLGDPSQIEMLVGRIPLQIFKTPNAYFAVLGKDAESLPKAQLSALAGQLSHPTH